MSETVMNDLPAEILIAILRKVDQESLRNAALTCKLWKELIESSCSWTLCLFHQNEDGSSEPWIDVLLATNRKFHKIKIDGLMELGRNRIVDIFQRHGSHISKLLVFDSCLDRFDVFVELLQCVPNLEHLILYRVRTPCTASDVPTEDKLPELVKLKKLELVESEGSIIKCFKRSKLTEFKVLNYEYNNQPMTQEPVLELLRTQHHLETLALRSIDYGSTTLFQNDIDMDGNVKFQLNQLSLLDIKLRESPNDYNNLLKFLKPQAKTIKFLELGTTFPDLVYEFVFAKFRNLKTLRLMMNELPKDMEFYERLEESQSLTQLIFMDSPPPNHLNNGCPPSLKEFIRHVPNVTDLTLLEECDRGTIQFIADTLVNLTRLTVAYFNEPIFGDLQFPNLRTLCVQKFVDDVDWDKFSQINSGITDILIDSGSFAGFSDWLEAGSSEFVEQMTKSLRLQKLIIGRPFRTNENFYQHIRKYGTDLKLIDLHKACALPAHIMQGIPGLRFHDDLTAPFRNMEIWNNEEDYDGRLPDIDRGGNWDDGENFLDPFDMHLMDIDDYEYDQQDDFDDGDYDDFVDEFDENSDVDEW